MTWSVDKSAVLLQFILKINFSWQSSCYTTACKKSLLLERHVVLHHNDITCFSTAPYLGVCSCWKWASSPLEEARSRSAVAVRTVALRACTKTITCIHFVRNLNLENFYWKGSTVDYVFLEWHSIKFCTGPSFLPLNLSTTTTYIHMYIRTYIPVAMSRNTLATLGPTCTTTW